MIDLQRANETLDVLAQAHQQGRLAQSEYRRCRRQLIDALRDSAAITCRNVAPADTGGEPAATAATSLSTPSDAGRWRLLLLGTGVVVVLALVGLLLGGAFDAYS